MNVIAVEIYEPVIYTPVIKNAGLGPAFKCNVLINYFSKTIL